ncbi:MAG: glycosyltransferase family 4 protein [Candidatus Hydrogenedentes bacterium]|nr:glycosyltransferase family 4 protein [Candidatus Hydrogenedentota bacterium]
MKMNIVMAGACPYPFPQGSQIYLRETARALAGLGHDVRMVVYGHGRGECAPDDPPLRRAGNWPFARDIEASGPSLTKPIHDAALWFTLRKTLNLEGADAVCAHNYEALLAALATLRRPVVYFAHNALADELPYYWQGRRRTRWAARLGRFFDETFPRRADRIIVPHRRLAGYLALRGCPQERLMVIPPPVDASAFGEPSAEQSAMPPVLYTGNIDAYQNLGLLLGAVARIRESRPSVRLLMATGDPPPFPGVEHLPGAGFDELRAALSGDVIVAVPRVSWSGYPIKLLNAMAAGRAVVACAGAAWPITDGVNGLVVPDNDREAFARALLRLMDQPRLRAELGQNARATILHEHDPGAVGRQIEQVLLEAADMAPDNAADVIQEG